VGREGAGRPRELAGEVLVRDDDPPERPAEPRGVHRHLLAEGRRRRRLAVGARQHRRVAVLLRQLDERVADLADRGDDHLAHRGLEQEALREVVHVLAGEPEVDPRVQRLRVVERRVGTFRDVRQPDAEEVLDRLHVVVCRVVPRGPLGLEGLDQPRVLDREVGVHLAERRRGRLVEADRRRVEGPQREQVLHLDAGPGAHQRGLARVRRQCRRSAGVAPVERRDGRERIVPGQPRDGVVGRRSGVVGHVRDCRRSQQKRVDGARHGRGSVSPSDRVETAFRSSIVYTRATRTAIDIPDRSDVRV